ncbi:malonyl-CoA decarboxylase, putative [Bodo saltans]|uniref:Malonyl-CoA decarboxylase, putative n=1 Tax=Bodo saltans TaxID=75058 RepID=A0A0S4J4K1_BODSA|nr:malonyl-CoA decarboxylase, putative [Bodo saltans]|eukprot:CUG86145.1 malonyl-CoA decarboxylase, putative [Bodo saltans]
MKRFASSRVSSAAAFARCFSAPVTGTSGTEESWYLDMWRRLVFPSQDSTLSRGEFDSSNSSTTPMEPRHFLRAAGNHLPDGAVNGLWELYHSIHEDDKASQFFVSVSRCGPDLDRVRSHQSKLMEVTAAYEQACKADVGDKQRQSAEKSFMKAVAAMDESATPICERWFRQSTALPNGIRWMMDLRRRLLHTITNTEKAFAAAKQAPEAKDALLETVLYDLKSLDERLLSSFKEFFAKQYLLLEELTWKTTSPYVLERVIASEAVHPFPPGGLDSMKLRIRGGLEVPLDNTHQRHLFALYHPAVADEPLVSIQVSLCSGIENSVDRILNRPTPLQGKEEASHNVQKKQPHPAPLKDTAIFYSINNAQPSLKGIELGSMLIKRVVSSITTQPYKYVDPLTNAPHPITQFSTLSPMPGFMRWLAAETSKLERGLPHRIFGSTDAETTSRHFSELKAAIGGGDMTHEQIMFVVLNMFSDSNEFTHRTPNHLWYWNDELTSALKAPMMRSAAAYLVEEKRRGNMLDPVGNFHVGNGAIVHRINWLANCSEKGSSESACIMVNYRYDLRMLGENSTKYALEHTVAVGDDIKNMLGATA